MAHDEVRIGCRGGEIGMGIAQRPENDVPDDEFGASPRVHDPRHRLAVMRIHVRSHRGEIDPLLLDQRPVERRHGQHRSMSALLQPEREPAPGAMIAPNVVTGTRVMAFIEAVLRSGQQSTWKKI